MNNDLIVNGKKYISVKRASEITRYNKDYIGELCRTGKVTAIREGKLWFIEFDSLLAHKNDNSYKDQNQYLNELEKSAKPAFSFYRVVVFYFFYILLASSTALFTAYPNQVIGRLFDSVDYAVDNTSSFVVSIMDAPEKFKDVTWSQISDNVELNANVFDTISSIGCSIKKIFTKNTACENFETESDFQEIVSDEPEESIEKNIIVDSATDNNFVKEIIKVQETQNSVSESRVIQIVNGLLENVLGTQNISNYVNYYPVYEQISKQAESDGENISKSISNLSDDIEDDISNAVSGGSTSFSGSSLDISGNGNFGGTVTATQFIGDGSALTGISGSGSFSTSTTRSVFSATSSLTYDSANGVFGISTSTLGLTTSDISEGSNLYFTNDRFDTRLSATTSLSNILTLSSLSTVGTIASGTWNGAVIGDSYITKSGDWTGTFDNQEGSYYLDRTNHSGTQLASTISDFSSTTRSLLSSSATGLSYNSITGDFSLSSGYNIPLTASTTEWNNKVSSQWTTSGSNIYFNTGNVGIGTTSPSNRLEVSGNSYFGGNVTATGTLTLSAPTASVGGSSGMLIVPNDTSGNYRPGIYSTGNGTALATYGNGSDSVGNGAGMYSRSVFGQTLTVGATGYGVNSNSGVTSGMLNFSSGSAIDLILSRAFTNTLRISSNGSSGSANLIVNGNTSIGTTSTSTTLTIQGEAGKDIFSIASSTGTRLFTVANTGNVGIFNSSPTNSLVVGSASGNGAVSFGVWPTDNGYGAIRFGTSAISSTNYALIGASGVPTILNSGTAGQPLQFAEAGSIKATLFNGNFGIGTTSPSAKFAITGTAGTGDIFTVASSTDSSLLTVTSAGNVVLPSSGSSLQIGSGSSRTDLAGGNGKFTFNINGNYRFSFAQNSGLGANVFTPYIGGVTLTSGFNETARASLYSPYSGAVEINSGTAGALRDLIVRNLSMGTTSTSTTLTIQGEAGKDIFSIASSTGTNLLTLTQAGNLGVGTLSPGYPLEVNGMARIQGLYGNTGSANTPTYSFVSETNSGMYRPGSGLLSFTVSGNDVIRLTSTGNVGIGTTTPSNKLEVAGNAYVGGNITATGTISSNSFRQNGSSGAGFITNANGSRASIYSNNAEAMYFSGTQILMGSTNWLTWGSNSAPSSGTADIGMSRLSSGVLGVGNGSYGNTDGTLITGNLGIGTTTPSNRLEVSGSTLLGGNLTATGTTIIGTSTATTGTTNPYSVLTVQTSSDGTPDVLTLRSARSGSPQGPSILFNDYTSGSNWAIGRIRSVDYANLGGGLIFEYKAGNGSANFTTSEGMRIDSSGNVGIGSTTPGSKLSITGSGTGTGRAFAVADSSNSEKFNILDNGNVNIGLGSWTTASSEKLFVTGNAMIQGSDGWNGNGDIAGLWFGNTGSQRLGFGYKYGSGFAVDVYKSGGSGFLGGTNSTNALTILDVSGNVGIGTTSPSDKFAVSGSTFLGGNVTATGTLALSGLSLSTTGNYLCIDTTTNQITSGTTCTLSSARFKNNVQNLDLGLDTVLALRPVTFNFNNGYGDNGSTDQLGFVAEEADAIDPRLVPHDKDGLPSGFNYQNYTAVLTKAIQEQQKQIEELKNATTTIITEQSIDSATSTAQELEQSQTFVQNIANLVKNIIQEAGELIVSTIKATVAVFDRVETQTASVSKGLEMKDQTTGDIYCVIIDNGEFQKIKGNCDDVDDVDNKNNNSTTTDDQLTDTSVQENSTNEQINDSNSTSTPEVATSTQEILSTDSDTDSGSENKEDTSTEPIEQIDINEEVESQTNEQSENQVEIQNQAQETETQTEPDPVNTQDTVTETSEESVSSPEVQTESQ